MGSNNSSSHKDDNITKTSRTPLTTESQQQQRQQQQPTQQHEETIDAIAAAAPVDDEDGVALANYFRELQLDLTKQMHERESRLPKCYEEGTFWITPPNAFFTLWNKTKKSNKNITHTTNTTTTNSTNPSSPTTATSSNNSIDSNNNNTSNNNNNKNNNNNNNNNDHLYSELICMKRPRIFVWLVHLLVDILYCPSETCHLKKLQSHGWATAPCARRILDLHSDFYLMSYRYKCTHCKRTFFGHDQAIRDSLPTALAEEFPAVLSHRSGISRSTLELMQSCSTSAIGPFTRILKEHHALRSARLKLQYLAAKKESETTLSHTHHSKKRKINNTTISSSAASTISSTSASTPSTSSSFVAIAPQPISNLNQHQRLSVPLPIAPRPPQVATPVFLPQPIFAMHPHLVALQHQQQQQLQHSQQQQQQQQALSPSSSSPPPPPPQQQQQEQQEQKTNRRTSTTPIVPKTAIPLQPLYYTLPRQRPNSSSPPQQGPTLQVLKKPRKPRTILKKPN